MSSRLPVLRGCGFFAFPCAGGRDCATGFCLPSRGGFGGFGACLKHRPRGWALVRVARAPHRVCAIRVCWCDVVVLALAGVSWIRLLRLPGVRRPRRGSLLLVAVAGRLRGLRRLRGALA